LATLAKTTESKAFELHVRMSTDKTQPRWNDAFLKENLMKIRDLQHVWVCGPPLMEEVFDRFLSVNSKAMGLEF